MSNQQDTNYQFQRKTRDTSVVTTHDVPAATQEISSFSLKRKRVDSEDKEVAFVKLPREELLQMTSQEYEEYVKRLSQMKAGGLTTTEQREVKRQRRLIKNREYAQTSRTRKKEMVSTIKTQLNNLSAEKEELEVKVQTLTSKLKKAEERNSKLTEENRKLKESLALSRDSPHPYSPTESHSQSPSVHPESPSHSSEESIPIADDVDQYFFKNPIPLQERYYMPTEEQYYKDVSALPRPQEGIIDSTYDWGATPSMYTSFTYLFIMMFAFGLFFQSGFFFGTKATEKLPFEVTQFSMEGRRTGRTLLEMYPVVASNNYAPQHNSSTSTRPISMMDVLMDEISNVKAAQHEVDNDTSCVPCQLQFVPNTLMELQV